MHPRTLLYPEEPILLRKLSPTLVILLCVTLDTTLIPMLYSGPYLVPLTMAMVFLIGMLMGRTNGILYGMIGGLLIDITAGTLGMMTFYMMAVGFMIGLILYTSTERPVLSHRQLRKNQLNRAMWVFILYTVGEIVLFFIQYFHTAVIEPVYFLNILIRSLILVALTVILRPVAHRIFVGSKRASASTGRTREVKSF